MRKYFQKVHDANGCFPSLLATLSSSDSDSVKSSTETSKTSLSSLILLGCEEQVCLVLFLFFFLQFRDDLFNFSRIVSQSTQLDKKGGTAERPTNSAVKQKLPTQQTRADRVNSEHYLAPARTVQPAVVPLDPGIPTYYQQKSLKLPDINYQTNEIIRNNDFVTLSDHITGCYWTDLVVWVGALGPVPIRHQGQFHQPFLADI